MSSSFNNLDDAFFSDIDDIYNNSDNNSDNDISISRKTSSLWTYITYKNPAHLGEPVCKKYNYVFSIKSGNSSIERHLLSKHNIIIPKVKRQTTLKFKCTDPWPAKEKMERDRAVIIWIIVDQQPFSVVENKLFIKMMNIFDFRYKVPDRHQIKVMVFKSLINVAQILVTIYKKYPEKFLLLPTCRHQL